MMIYGKNVVKEAIFAKRRINKVFIDNKFGDQKFLSFLTNNNINYQSTNKGELNNMTNNALHQGVVALVDEYRVYDLDEILNRNEKQRFLILDEIQDPHNLGAIMRSAEATKVDGIIVAKKHQVPLTGVVAKTSSGAIEYVKMIYVSNLYTTILKLKENGVMIIGTSGEADTDYKDIKCEGSIAIVMGSEGDGLRQLIKKGCDVLVKIPMYGKVNSLNVSVATALLLYSTLQ